MKILSYNIRLLLLFILLGTCTMSCLKDMEEVNNVEIIFNATLQDDACTRAFGDGLSVNTLVVGIFDEKLEEIERKEFPITSLSINVQLALAKNQVYNFVFWAYDSNSDIYGLNDLTAIKMNDLPGPITFSQSETADAFFAAMEDITITGIGNYTVELVRPLAQINVGTSGAAVKTSFSVKNTADTFHPFTKTVSGEKTFTWTFETTTGETFFVNEIPYTYLATGYLFAPFEQAAQKTFELKLNDMEPGFSSLVELRANHRSNIVGNFTK